MITSSDLTIPKLGPSIIASPTGPLMSKMASKAHFVGDDNFVVFDTDCNFLKNSFSSNHAIPSLEVAGPRPKIFFDPKKTRAAIVTCGGLCPGLNDVIRALVMTLYYRYGVKNILGIPYGYQGFISKYGHKSVALTPDLVSDIHTKGGTLLGTSRGEESTAAIADYLKAQKINILFVIGGDGTFRGALDLAKTIEDRKEKISLIGIPKTVDNDILYIDRSFGFATAVSAAAKIVTTAHLEARSQPNGIGLVKLMGRHSGFITCLAALATADANFVLIPEVKFELDGKKGFLKSLETRLKNRGHAVILVAEGAGQELIPKGQRGHDASGNIRFKDIGLFLKEKINEYFKIQKTQVNLKYIDPSYVIRAVEASAVDSVYCLRLGQNAVHAAMSGRTKMVVGKRHNHYVHLPMTIMAKGRQQVDPNSDIWLSVLEATGQPAHFGPSPRP
jgi:6-phosphofructokinase 1